MGKKITSWKTKGMNRDLSVSVFNPEFAFENRNLRLTANENNTSLSWVTEKGTAGLPIVEIKAYQNNSWVDRTEYGLLGIPVGTAVINHQLVLFTHSEGNVDRIYVLEYTDANKDSIKGKLLYLGNLKLSLDHPLETRAYYEAEHIQKVYWTDGINQPRLINIAASESKLNKFNTFINKDTIFDFVPAVWMNETVNIIQHTASGGLFAPGVIQYCITYINKYAQQTNVVYVSPLYFLSHVDRGASPEDKVTSSFEIQIYNSDKNFDFVRLYSIQRTSLDAEPIVKLLNDIPVEGTTPSEIYSTEVVYSEANTLPRDGNGKILTVIAHNGSYTVAVTASTSTASGGYSRNSDFVFYAQNNHSGAIGEKVPIMTLQELIDENPDACFVGDYHAGITMTAGICAKLLDYADYGEHRDEWAFYIGDTMFSAAFMAGKKLVYSCQNQKWYITIENVVETVTKDESTGGNYITYIDNGTSGSIVDPTELLYVGGKEISALTMADKDNTLFLGNITQYNTLVNSIQDYYDNIRNTDGNDNDTMGISFVNNSITKQITLNHSTGVYSNTNTLLHNMEEISTFKGGETYRFGFQLQKATGEWTEPIFMNDVTNDKYPNVTITSDIVKLPYATSNIQLQDLGLVNSSGDNVSVFKKIRPVIVYPSISDRTILCQGVLNPTVFNVQDRIDNSPFAQPSWFFRPYMVNDDEADNSETIDPPTVVSSTIGDADWATLNLDPTTTDTGKASYFVDNGFVKEVYALVATFPNTATRDAILSRGYLKTHERNYYRSVLELDQPPENDDDDYTYEFIGAFILSGTLTYAFLFDKKVYEEYDIPLRYNQDNTVEEERSLKYLDGITDVHVEERKFKIYSKIGVSSNHILYYQKPAGGPSNLVFTFYVEKNKKYVATFAAITNTDTEYFPNTGDASGEFLRFTHYDSLFTTDDMVGGNIRDNARQLEIQGAKRAFDTAYDTITSRKSKSDTQFFVDQSIVTLNSPDIEFDTEVQAYGTEGLKLRIIGAVPITANISSHKITHSSMLEVGHNHENKGIINFGSGEINYNVLHNNISPHAGRRLVSEYMWKDVIVRNAPEYADKDGIDTSNVMTFLVYPWNRTGSLNNDYRTRDVASSLLKTKKMSNSLYSINSKYFQSAGIGTKDYDYISAQISLTENSEINVRLSKQQSTTSEINYYPSIDRVLTNGDGYKPLIHENYAGIMPNLTDPISMKYKSTSHAVISLKASDMTSGTAQIPLLPYGVNGGTNIGKFNYTGGTYKPFWGDDNSYYRFNQSNYVDLTTLFGATKYNFLWLGELYKEPSNRFGGKSKEAVRNNTWLVAGDSIALASPSIHSVNNKYVVTLNWTVGDTYYQRYDSLKTYAYTPEDTNQIVEILSFMCETHVNIDGRYDKNRGQVNAHNLDPTVFNLLNPVYSQKDNYFNYRKLDMDDMDKLYYPNHIFFTKTKTSGADVDLWTNVTLASVLEMDGSLGKISSLRKLNDQLICFQDTGISQIMYNENVQVASTTGVPIELANSGKVQGKRYISNSVGCANKWSVVNTPMGIYFISDVDRNIYLFNGQLNNLSVANGFNSWCKTNIPALSDLVKWTPDKFSNFVSYYDRQNQDVLFINRDIALAYSEKTGLFTSFYDYGGVPYLCNLDDTCIWLKQFTDSGSGHDIWKTGLHKHNAGLYCNFFGNNRPYWMTLVGNPEPLKDKIFTNIEFRAAIEGDGVEETEVVDGETVKTGKFIPSLPFTSLETWNEYQHGIAYLQNRNGHNYFKHHTSDNYASLKRKFRIWRCDIPRDNYPLPEDTEENPIPEINTELGIARYAKHPMDRMRNPWLYLKLFKGQAGLGSSLPKAEIHDVVMTYFD